MDSTGDEKGIVLVSPSDITALVDWAWNAKLLTYLLVSSADIVFVCIPGHVTDINDKSAADFAVCGDTSEEIVPYSDVKYRLDIYTIEL